MPHAPLRDDGRVVTLDLHHRSVAEAERLIVRVVQEAARRGRDRVRVVHGASTSDARYRNRTIKHALLDLIDTGSLEPWVAQALPGDSVTVLALALGRRQDPARMQWSDLDDATSEGW